MLAGKLYQINKNSVKNQPKTQVPIKKIFYKNNKIIIDQKTLEEYASDTTTTTKQLQNWLEMPLNTIDAKILNLPNYGTGAASANPYIEMYGSRKTNRLLETKLTISIGKKPNHIEHTLDLTDGEISCKACHKTTLRIDRKKYFLNSNTLFSEYVDSGIIDESSNLNTEKYNEIIQEFLNYAKKQKPEFTKIGNNSFRIYILPDDSTIEYKQEENKQEENPDSEQTSFIDYFGNTVTNYASSTTKSAKFLTYDDRAFTINCMQKKDFYENLGIGDTSLEKIYVDSSQTFTINRLNWTFTDMSNPDHKFIETRKGILTQIYENYRRLSAEKGVKQLSQLNVICIKKDQSKQEILIDENLTMKKLKNMFSNIKDIPPLCFEVFIDDSAQNPIWSTYLYVVKNFLAGNKTPKTFLLSYFNKMLKLKRYDWTKLKDESEPKKFFSKSNFCLQHLSICNNTQLHMDYNEGFAEKIGQIARTYIGFKQKHDRMDNSLSDILTYSKYDRERLRHIVSRVGKGVQLSKVSDDIKKNVTEKISSLQPKEEIADDVASKDFSYFFFKGYYTAEMTT